jgi:transcriptional repressor NrdR
MICSICKKGETSVVDSRPTEDGTAIRRRRLCVCGARFTTFERVQFREIMVIKKKMAENHLLIEINYLNLFI